MGLIDLMKGSLDKTRASISRDPGKTVDYLVDYKLRDYFSDDVPEKERATRRAALERMVGSRFDEAGEILGGAVRKIGSKGAMGAAIANQLYWYASATVPLAGVTAAVTGLFGAKTAVEAPALKRYWDKTHDLYGVGEILLMKPLNYLLPIVGPMAESGHMERVVRSHAGKSAALDFIKAYGKYEPLEERVDAELKSPIAGRINMPVRKAA